MMSGMRDSPVRYSGDDAYEVARLVVQHTASLCVARTLGSTCKSAHAERRHLIDKSDLLVASFKKTSSGAHVFDLSSFRACTRHAAIRKGAAGLRADLSGPALRLSDPFGPRYNLLQHALSCGNHDFSKRAVEHLVDLVGQDEVARMLVESRALRAATDPRVVHGVISMLRPGLLPRLTEDLSACLDNMLLGDRSEYARSLGDALQLQLDEACMAVQLSALQKILDEVPSSAARGLALGLARRNGCLFKSTQVFKSTLSLCTRLWGIVGLDTFLKSNGVHLLMLLHEHAGICPDTVECVFKKVVKRMYMALAPGGWDLLVKHVWASGAYVCRQVVVALLHNAGGCPVKVSHVVRMLFVNFRDGHCEWQADMVAGTFADLEDRGSEAAMATVSLLGFVICVLRHNHSAVDRLCQILNDRLKVTVMPVEPASCAMGHRALLHLLRNKWFAIAKLCYVDWSLGGGDSTDRAMVKAGMDMVYAM